MDTNINEKARGQGTRKEEKQEMENIYLWKGQGRGEQNREIKDMWNDEKRVLNKIGNMQHKKTETWWMKRQRKKDQEKTKKIWRTEKVLVIRNGKRGTENDK